MIGQYRASLAPNEKRFSRRDLEENVVLDRPLIHGQAIGGIALHGHLHTVLQSLSSVTPAKDPRLLRMQGEDIPGMRA